MNSKAFPIIGYPAGPGIFSANSRKWLREIFQQAYHNIAAGTNKKQKILDADNAPLCEVMSGVAVVADILNADKKQMFQNNLNKFILECRKE